ncbi:MAG: uracil-DNA glycosylase [Geminicoccaceae bacterium]
MRSTPASSCALCPRLVAFRRENQAQYGEWHNAPVPSFGAGNARLLIVGLAPGLRGANRTGRPFTGDFAGDLLYPTLLRFGFAKGTFSAAIDDGLELVDCRITNAVRCVPPANKPVGAEINACRRFLCDEVATGASARNTAPAIILTLGGIAHGSTLRALGLKASSYPFVHGAFYPIGKGTPKNGGSGNGQVLASSYHCSRYNVNTRRLTSEMFETVIGEVKDRLASQAV